MPYISASVQHWNDADRMLQNDELSPGNTLLIPEERLLDNNSIRSLPIVSVADVLPPSIRPSTGHSPSLTPRISPLMSSRSIRSETVRSAARIGAPRVGTELRHLNRLSGFLSNLLHRRNATNSAPLHNGGPAVESSAGPDDLSNANLAKSFTVPPRANSPPPSLPPPTLQELGLSLSVLTPDLSPPHFSAPPASGAFLAPHYLLLCHSQGLDVFPLKSPPALQPYALIRRVNFKNVVVMEQRGVLVAIAGRRDGVRVYALDEIKRAVEWRIDMEIRRERDRIKRESSKRVVWGGIGFEQRGSAAKGNTATITRAANVDRSAAATPNPKSPAIHPNVFTGAQFVDSPPAYISPPDRTPIHRPHDLPFIPPPMDRHRGVEHMDSKVSQWLEGSSEDEAIDMLTAGASGSRALDERTSASTSPHIGDSMSTSHFLTGNQSAQSVHRVRPTDPSLVRPDNASIVPPEPLPSPSLSTLRQALQDTSLAFRSAPTYTANNIMGEPDAHHPDIDEEDDEDGASSTGERITLAQALMESRLPHLPPPVTQHLPQSSLAQVPRSGLAAVGRVSSDLRLSDAPSPHGRVGQIEVRRRRWSVLEGLFSNASGMLLSPPFSYEGSNTTFPPEVSFSSRGSLYTSLHVRPEATQNHTATSNDVTPVVSSQLTSQMPLRFLQRNLNNTHHNRRADVPLPMPLVADVGKEKGNIHLSTASHVPPPRLEYVKLPGTKGSLIVKAVETPKKSFLAILCGENGEKVELFAGTYRSALGLSRTFILPDSPRSLELQLQGDDLVEVFLVFSQNVFGLEPATVRVREVRIGRAERRAARRRVREIRSGQTDIFEGDLLAPDDEDANISINIGVSLAGNESRITRTTSNSQLQDIPRTSTEMNHDTALAHAEELVAMTTTHMGPYTTFQQLSFAPKFPLATIANDYIIPPTYPQFLEYRSEYEPGNSDADLSQTQFSPPGLPKPVPTPPSKWLYRDPKGATHGPWKASLMQAWYNDGLLPPDLPVRKEQDTQFILLKDLRQQSIDPSHPFRLVAHSGSEPQSSSLDVSKPLLSPVSLLAQPRHFGPPALFYSSRGGHSTTIVDARGRSVLQGRFLWSEDSGQKASESSMGDIKHLEAFDVEDRSVIVAMRQGGLEAMDFGDALLKPADQSRTVLPHFTPSPSNINRREPFVWKIGTPIASSFPPAAVVPSKATSSYPGRKRAVKTARGTGASINGVHEAVGQNEVLFLGREGDIIYLCERTANTFKILRLCPGHSVAS